MCWLSAVFLSSTNYGGCEVFVLVDMNDEIGKERERERKFKLIYNHIMVVFVSLD